jgi:hypothetical protein
MAAITILGKRKRRASLEPKAKPDTPSKDIKKAQDLFQKHFEAAFQPIAVNDRTSDIDTSEYGDNTDWEGISEAEEEDIPDVQVIEHVHAISDTSILDAKSARKAYMTSKPPPTSTAQTSTKSSNLDATSSKTKSATELTSEDLALHRLLTESHLLSESTTSLDPTLKARHAAQDLRLRALGAKKPLAVLSAGNMPMVARKGIQNKRKMKEDERRREAQEAGIILEREGGKKTREREKTRGKSKSAYKRDVGAPSVGRWKGGTLVLGKSDVAEIERQAKPGDFLKKKKRKKGKR